MRLWHYALIPVLPNKMLLSQWRECVAIKRQWEKGSLKHPLVSYVMLYNRRYFRNYIIVVTHELAIRGFDINADLIFEMYNFWIKSEDLDDYKIFYPEHNARYLKQCYYNLQEKYDNGIITKDELNKIETAVFSLENTIK